MKRPTYVIFIDILGYDKFAQEISRETKLNSSYVRQFFLINPLIQAITKYGESINFRQFTDNFLVFAYNVDTIFQIVNEVSKLVVPFERPKLIPLEIAIGLAELEPNYDPIAQDETIQLLKLQLLESYRRYYKQEHGISPRDTFVVITKEFFNVLPQDRKFLCKKIVPAENTNHGIEFYSAQLQMMQDVSGRNTREISKIEKFLQKINDINLWNHFEVKILIFRESVTRRWIIQFIYVRLLSKHIEGRSKRFNNLILIHNVYHINELRSFLYQINNSEELGINDFPSASLQEINQRSEYYFSGYINNYRISSPADIFGIHEPVHILLKGGKAPALLSDSELLTVEDLQDYDQISPIVDAVSQELSLNFWDFSYDAFFVTIAPLGIDKPQISFKDKEIGVKISCREDIDPSDIMIKAIGKLGNKNSHWRLSDNNFVRDNGSIVYVKTVEVTEEDGAIIDLYHKDERFENYYATRERMGKKGQDTDSDLDLSNV